MDVMQALTASPTLEILEPSAESGFLAYLIAIAFGVVFMMSAITFGTTIAQSVVEETQTRIVEILLATVSALLLGELGTAFIWFGVLFAFGFVLLAALYAALASLVSRQEDIGSVTGPVMMLVMMPYIAVIVFYNNPTALAIMSYIPFSAPVGMPMRMYLGTAEWWEPLVSIAILSVSIAIVWVLGARIYSGSILRTGPRVKLRDAVKG